MTKSLLAKIVERIRAACDPDRIILFGSPARGKARRNSDIDLMVVKRGVRNRDRLARRLYEAMGELDAPVDILVATPRILKEYGDCCFLVYYYVVHEGKTVYAKIH